MQRQTAPGPTKKTTASRGAAGAEPPPDRRTRSAPVALPAVSPEEQLEAALDGRRTRWDSHRAQRRAELVAVAAAAIGRHGSDVDMEQVAAAAGVKKPVLYRYFADKAQLWTAVGEHMAQFVVDAVAPAVEHVDTGRELVVTTIDAYLAAIESHPEVYRFIAYRSGPPTMPHVMADPARTVATGLAQVIGDRLRSMGLDQGGAEPWAHGMVGLAQSAGDWWIRHSRPMSRAALTEYLTALVWDGLSGIQADVGPAGRCAPGEVRRTTDERTAAVGAMPSRSGSGAP